MTPEDPKPSEEQVEERAEELATGGEDDDKVAEGDVNRARRAADAILEESEERTFDNATVDPDDDSITRRTSSETA